MRHFALLAAVGVVLAGTGFAVAQPAPPPGAPPPGGPGPMGEGGPPAMRHGGMMGGMMEGGPHGMRHMMRPSKAARFHFERGEAVADIKCADDETMRACVDAASTLLDKLAAQPAR